MDWYLAGSKGGFFSRTITGNSQMIIPTSAEEALIVEIPEQVTSPDGRFEMRMEVSSFTPCFAYLRTRQCVVTDLSVTAIRTLPRSIPITRTLQ